MGRRVPAKFEVCLWNANIFSKFPSQKYNENEMFGAIKKMKNIEKTALV